MRGMLGMLGGALGLALAYLGFRAVPSGFIPQQDQGYLITAVVLPDGATIAQSPHASRVGKPASARCGTARTCRSSWPPTSTWSRA